MTVETWPRMLSTAPEAISAARGFAAEIAPGAIDRDLGGTLPVGELAAFDASGLLAITLDPRDGGPGLGPPVLADVVRTIAAADPAIAQAPQGHYLMVDAVTVLGDTDQRDRLLNEVKAGHRLGNALAERGGAHAQELRTRLSDGRLNGRKYYATGALTARWLGVTAVNDDGRIALVFVSADAHGVTLDREWNVMGQRATVSGGASFEQVAVDPSLVLDYQAAFERPQQLGARAQLYHAAIQVGIARGALDDARWFVADKARPFFEAVHAGWAERAVDDPYTIHRFGVMATQVAAAEALLSQAARTLEQIGRAPADEAAAARGSIAVAQAKAFASEVAVGVASDLFSLTGASAADERYDLGRHWRNARTHASHDPVDWKYHHVGNYLVRDVLPPSHGQL